jgi:hypothetical protein
MVGFVAFVLAVYGAAAAVTVLHVGKAFREAAERTGSETVKQFVNCPACVGFWIGCATSAWVYPGPSGLWYVDGFVALGACWIIHVLLVCAGMWDKV